MRVTVAILCLAAWLLYVGQLISVVNFPLAQRLGLQESPDHADPLASCLELWTARWDAFWLWTLPLAGILMLMNHWFWPYMALIGGGAFVDAGGREAAKVLGLNQKGVSTGSRREQRIIAGAFVFITAVGCLAIAVSLAAVV